MDSLLQLWFLLPKQLHLMCYLIGYVRFVLQGDRPNHERHRGCLEPDASPHQHLAAVVVALLKRHQTCQQHAGSRNRPCPRSIKTTMNSKEISFTPSFQALNSSQLLKNTRESRLVNSRLMSYNIIRHGRLKNQRKNHKSAHEFSLNSQKTE